VLVICLLAGGGVIAGTADYAPPRYVAHGVNGGFWHGRLHLWKVSLQTALDRPLAGYGADAYLAATLQRQGEDPIRFAHSLPLEVTVELGAVGLVLIVVLYATTAGLIWRRRRNGAFWLLGPAVAGFLIASLLDWPWHLAGSGSVWAAALGGLTGRVRHQRPGAIKGRTTPPRLMAQNCGSEGLG
jgi:O-antigen ligase